MDRHREFSRSHRPYSWAVLVMVLLQCGRGSWRDGKGDEAQGQDTWRGQAFPPGHWEALASQKGRWQEGLGSGVSTLSCFRLKGRNGPTPGTWLTVSSLPPPALLEGLQSSQETPLAVCMKHEDFDMAFVLLTKGADPRNISLTEGDTPLHAALHIFLDIKGRLHSVSSLFLEDETGY